MGVAEGVATLDENGLVPSSQLPSFVDDVLEYDSKDNFPTAGETGKIYVATDTNLTYRWSGTQYVEISASLALGETSSTAYAGDKGKDVADKLAKVRNTQLSHIKDTDTFSTTAEKVSLNYDCYVGDQYGGEATSHSVDIPVASKIQAGIITSTDKIIIDNVTDDIATAKSEIINNASEGYDTLSGLESKIKEVSAQASAARTKVNTKANGHVTVAVEEKKTTEGVSYSEVTVSEDDIASAADLTDEIERAKDAEDKIEESVGLNADGSHKTTTGHYTSVATTITGEIAALDTQVKTNTDAIDVLNGADTVKGSVAKSIKDTVEALDADEVGGEGKVITTISEADGKISATAIDLTAANVAATATEATDDKVAVDGATVDAQIGSLAKSIKDTQKSAATYKVKKVETGLAANVKEAYQLVQTVDGKDTDVQVQIPVYKDSSLKSVELVDEKPATKTEEAVKGQFLKFTYITNEGVENIVYLDCSKFLVESEFKKGLTVNAAGEVSVLISEKSDTYGNNTPYLTVGEDGVKLNGINTQLNTKVDKVDNKGLSTNDYTTEEKNKLSGIAEGANNYTLPVASTSTLGGVKVGNNLSILNGVLSSKDTTYSTATQSASGLMSADDKKKLDGVAAEANKYIHPSYTAVASGLYKVTVDNTGHVSVTTAVNKTDITALGIPS